MQLLFAELGVKPENLVFVSGIGCAARFPYYMNVYGLHSIHGRAPAIATGVALARPDLDVWVIGGDGDALSIGGNHLIHSLRRNVNLKIVMFNNQIYGLTKGQILADERGRQGHEVVTVRIARHAVQPDLDRARRGGDLRRAHARPRSQGDDRRHRYAHRRKGAAFVEIYQNCNVFNDGAFGAIAAKEARADMLIDLHHGHRRIDARQEMPAFDQHVHGKHEVATRRGSNHRAIVANPHANGGIVYSATEKTVDEREFVHSGASAPSATLMPDVRHMQRRRRDQAVAAPRRSASISVARTKAANLSRTPLT